MKHKFYYCLTLVILITSNIEVCAQNNTLDNSLITLSPKNIKIEIKDIDSKMGSYVTKINNKLSSFDENKSNECDTSTISSLIKLSTNSSRGLIDDINFLLGLNYEVCSDLSNAKKYYEKSLELKRRNAIALYRLAIIYIKEKDFKKANDLIQEAKWEKFSDQFILSYLLGIIDLENKEFEKALNNFNTSLTKNPHYLPAIKASYKTKILIKPTVKDVKKNALLDSQINNDIEMINRLEPENPDFANKYMRYLLASGDSLNSPNKLNEGLKISNFWIEKTKMNKSEFILLKVQFLEKLKNNDEALKFLTELENKAPLSVVLKAKKDNLLNESLSEENQ